ncbi:hypothetical protein D9619_000239 [Psilocybe cf. subviscida]|uniref:Cation/H+ exchanger transmembrane domain-containing protein n=1 Tax=Psilocybe cf. subviscida TaxID=2480587 RepID=A0A8H5F3X5_9AGAR|nr:hypothetical protein D9619_000239 [Psilocybe cf. subviscida]
MKRLLWVNSVTTSSNSSRGLPLSRSSLLTASVTEQGGVISGDDPTHYNPSNPIRLWIIQLVIIVSMTQFLSLFLSRIRQPRVIAEVIGGVILGPTVMGKIPHFQEKIFPKDSIPLLTVTSTVGLILFLFLVALEIDTRLLKRNIRAAATVSVAGLGIPLALGAGLGAGVYNEFIKPLDKNVNYGYFLLFVAVAIGITAFPVLCRILTELKLLDTEVGLVTLSAGIGNDVVGWVLLALTVALVNASSPLTALWVLLASAGYTVVLLFPGKWAYRWLAQRSGSLEQGTPTPLMMTLTLLIVFISAFFTDIIGVHAIFGGFLAGLIIPHDNGYAISIVEKIEDLVSILFLPIYFTLSGLKTDLSLLDNGITWGYIILICAVAFLSKFLSSGIAAYANGFNWRESSAIGSLMSCKGLVELIVLNIGLQADILDPRTFSMFVVHALVLTFMTTPLVIFFYPPQFRIHHRGDGTKGGQETSAPAPKPIGDDEQRTKFVVVLDKIEAIPAAMTISQLLQPSALETASNEEKIVVATSAAPSTIKIEALRLMELTNRTSAVLRSQEAESLILNDPVVSVYRTFGQLNSLQVSASLSVVNFDEFPQAIADHVRATHSEMVIVPWPRGVTSVADSDEAGTGAIKSEARNPFDGVFHRTTTQDQTSSYVYSEHIRNVFAKSPSDTALFVDRGISGTPQAGNQQHLFLAFIGGPDDRLALSFLVQLCERPWVTATVVKIVKTDDDVKEKNSSEETSTPPTQPNLHHTVAAADTVYGQHNTQTRLASDTADNILWSRYAQPSSSPKSGGALSRIAFHTENAARPLHRIVELVKEEVAESATEAEKALIVIAGRSRRLAVESLSAEYSAMTAQLAAPVSSSVPKTLGDVGAALVSSNVNASLLVVQAGPSAAL